MNELLPTPTSLAPPTLTLALTGDVTSRARDRGVAADGVPGSGRDEYDRATASTLIARSRERRALDRMLDALRERRGGALVLRGEPGIGKTALLEELRARSAGCRIVVARAAQGELEVPCAGLHQVCAPLFEHLHRLPTPQRTALATTFGLTDGVPPDRLRLGLAVRALFMQVAEDRPLACLVDDAQWLDPASSQVLSFVARRLEAAPVALVFATREPGEWLGGLPEMTVARLPDRDARALLLSVIPGPLDARVADRMVAETNGNPLAVLQVARALTPTQLAGGFGHPGAGPETGLVGKDVARRLAGLEPESRLFLVVAAAEPLSDPVALWRAVERLAIPADAVDAARDAGLLDVGSRVHFRHASVRRAVYRSATPAELRAAHGALADPEREPGLCAWHRARVTPVPDEQTADEVERASTHASVSGGLAAQASFLLDAAALTPEPAQRARRALAAAEAAWLAGDTEAALDALSGAESGPIGRLGRARAGLLRGRIAFASGASDAARRLFDAAKQLEPLDPGAAREAYGDALCATISLGPGGGCDQREVARHALAARPTHTRRSEDLLLEAVARHSLEGHAAAAQPLRDSLAAVVRDEPSNAEGPFSGWLAAHAARQLWEHGVEKRLAERSAASARSRGALALLPGTLTQRVEISLREGGLAEAQALVHELNASAVAAHTEAPIHAALLMTAYRGRDDRTKQLTAEAAALRAPDRRPSALFNVEFAELVLYNGLGRYDEALQSGRRILDEGGPVDRAPWTLPEVVEAAARSGAVDDAHAALRRLAENASGSDWALGVLARSHALLSNGPQAEQLYREALVRLSRTSCRVDLARAHLVYGEWLRRAGRRVDARKPLRTAHAMLKAMGVEAFAERAARELRATGATARKRVIETRDDLTPQEKEIARLARDGLSNPEIGARLFISPRTVEWHLRKVFVKLGVTSRVALRDALPPEQICVPV